MLAVANESGITFKPFLSTENTNYSKSYENTTCMDENGEYYKIYKMKCEGFFINMIKSKTNIFDNNYCNFCDSFFLNKLVK